MRRLVHWTGLADPTALVTARNAPAHQRVIKTLRTWGVQLDESVFLGGVDKAEILDAMRPHIFFDDQLTHLERILDQERVEREVGIRSEEARGGPIPTHRPPTDQVIRGSASPTWLGDVLRAFKRLITDPMDDAGARIDSTRATTDPRSRGTPVETFFSGVLRCLGP